MLATDLEPADVELLQRVAEKRDQQAFAELFERYHKRAYRVACYITHDEVEAEEALQEAMITIWNSAGSYKGSGKIESWIMTIVTHAAVRQIRARKRKRSQPMTDTEYQFDGPLPHVRMADTEMLLLLRGALAALTAPERQLLALRFAAGMSQPEISAALRIPQQTVSYRIDAIIKRLRNLLPHADFSAALPLAELVRELLVNGGPPVPADVCARVMKSLSNPKSFSKRRSSRAARTVPRSKVAVVAVGSIVLCAAAMVVVYSNSAAPAPAIAPAAPVPAPAAPAVPEPRQAFFYERKFEAGVPADLKVVGMGGWDQAQKVLTAKPVNAIILPFALPNKPLKVTCELFWHPDRVFSCAVNPVEPGALADGDYRLCRAARAWAGDFKNGPPGDYGLLPGGRRICVAYLWGHTITEFFGDFPARVIEFNEPLAGKKLALKFNNSELVSFRVEEVEEIPPARKDLKKLTAGLDLMQP